MSLPICCLALVISLQAALPAASASAQTPLPRSVTPPTSDTYPSWIAQYGAGFGGSFSQKNLSPRLQITLISGDDQLPGVPDPKLSISFSPIVTTTFTVTNDGSLNMTRITPMAIQGGGDGGKLPAADFNRLLALIPTLPGDHSRLPPRGRRLVVKADTPSGFLARVYDRANLPQSVLEMLRLVGADTWPVFPFPDFPPGQRWPQPSTANPWPTEVQSFTQTDRRLLATSPDGRLLATEINPTQFYNSTVKIENLPHTRENPLDPNEETILRIQDKATGSPVHEFHEPMDGRSFVFLYAARFTPDGRHLLVMSSLPDLRIYDTSTWQQVETLPGVPAHALAYYPSQDWKRAVAVLPSGETTLIDTSSGRTLARVDLGQDLKSVVFSPNGSTVAIVTERTFPPGPYGSALRLWDTRTGALLHELRPLEGTPHDAFEEPAWSPGARYLFAPTREGHSGPDIIGIWNADTGRYRGALAGCTAPDAPWTRFLLTGTRFYKTCNDGLMMWNIDQVLATIAAFEQTLNP